MRAENSRAAKPTEAHPVMTDFDDQDDIRRATIQLDVYGLSVSGTPAPAPEAPTSWREVMHRINRHLMTIAERCFGLVADLLVGLSNVVRGLTGSIANARSRGQAENI